jgi:hypothetical protein
VEKAIEDIGMAIVKSNPGQRDVKEKNVNAKNYKNTLLEFRVKLLSITSNLGKNKYTEQMVHTTQRLTKFESIDCIMSNSECTIDLR